MRKLLILACLLLPSTATAQTWAQFVLGGGYEAVFIVSNKTAFLWSGSISIYQGYNAAWAGRWYVNGAEFTMSTGYHISLAPFATSRLIITGDSTLRVGYMDFDSDLSYSTLDTAYSFFYNLRASSGDLLETVGGSKTAWGNKMVFAVERSAKVDTGYAWCPSSRYSTTPFPIVLTLYNADGTIYASKQVSLAGHIAIFVSQVFNMPQDFVGFLKVDGQSYFYLTVLRQETNAAGVQFTSVLPDTYVQF